MAAEHKSYSLAEKIKYYRKRSKDESLTENQRSFAKGYVDAATKLEAGSSLGTVYSFSSGANKAANVKKGSAAKTLD